MGGAMVCGEGGRKNEKNTMAFSGGSSREGGRGQLGGKTWNSSPPLVQMVRCGVYIYIYIYIYIAMAHIHVLLCRVYVVIHAHVPGVCGVCTRGEMCVEVCVRLSVVCHSLGIYFSLCILVYIPGTERSRRCQNSYGGPNATIRR